MSIGETVIDAFIEGFASQKALAEKAIVQVSDEDLRRPLSAETNSIAVIMKHVAGNLRSRFTDFLFVDGEKPWRNRDEEFVDQYAGREEIIADWESGWGVLFEALETLDPAVLGSNVFIRGQAHTIPMALGRSLAHVGYHAGQIVLTARVLCGDRWTTITVPRGGTGAYNRSLGYGPGDRGAGT